MSLSIPRALTRSSSTSRSPLTTLIASKMQTRLHSRYSVPAGAWDAHMHVTDLSLFPSPQKRANPEYQAHSSTLDGARANATRISVPNLAFVQVSTYGKDNSCLLWCLSELDKDISQHRQRNKQEPPSGTPDSAPQPHSGRGVVDFDPSTTTAETLQAWHAAGVRGVRVNYKSVGATPTSSEIESTLLALDTSIATAGLTETWGIHVHASLSSMPALAAAQPSVQAKLCIDHMGSPPRGFADAERDVAATPGWKALLELAGRDRVFVKISAPFRFLGGKEGDAREWARFEPLVKQLLAARGGRAAVFASDWPHTRFEGTDIAPWVDMCLEWCGEDDGLRERLFRDNAEALYDFKRE